MQIRRWSVVAGLVATAILIAPGTASAVTRKVSGTMTGHGVFDAGSCGFRSLRDSGSGTFTAPGLGHGTYQTEICVPDSGSPYSGTAKFSTGSGATLSGTIGSSPTGQAVFTFTVISGTKRFKHATGSLLLGPLVGTNVTNCIPTGDPSRPVICLDEDETLPINGTLRHVRHHR